MFTQVAKEHNLNNQIQKLVPILCANNESSEAFGIIKAGRRGQLKGHRL